VVVALRNTRRLTGDHPVPNEASKSSPLKAGQVSSLTNRTGALIV